MTRRMSLMLPALPLLPVRPALLACLTAALLVPLPSASPAGSLGAQQPSAASTRRAAGSRPPTVGDATAFMRDAETRLAALSVKYNQASWVAANFITEDTEALSADAERDFSVAVQQLATEAKRFDKVM